VELTNLRYQAEYLIPTRQKYQVKRFGSADPTHFATLNYSTRVKERVFVVGKT
jgi:hypothetical protein